MQAQPGTEISTPKKTAKIFMKILPSQGENNIPGTRAQTIAFET
jgi:hypothetical protein